MSAVRFTISGSSCASMKPIRMSGRFSRIFRAAATEPGIAWPAPMSTSRRELDEFAHGRACRKSLDALVKHGLDIGPELDCLSDEIARTQRQLDHKVQRVTVKGKAVFEW